MLNLVTNQCSICFEDIRREEATMSHSTAAEVDHIFHKHCLENWFSYAPHRQCPTCCQEPPEFRQTSSLAEDIALLGKVIILIPTMPFILGSLIAKELGKIIF
jgi:hypothetical protein